MKPYCPQDGENCERCSPTTRTIARFGPCSFTAREYPGYVFTGILEFAELEPYGITEVVVTDKERRFTVLYLPAGERKKTYEEIEEELWEWFDKLWKITDGTTERI